MVTVAKRALKRSLRRSFLQPSRRLGAQALLSFGADGLSGHPDHVAIGRCAAEAFCRDESLAALYTVAVPASLVDALDLRQLQAVPDADIALAVDVSAAWETEAGGDPLPRHPTDRFADAAGTR